MEGRREGGGRASSSEEAAVMAVEPRGPAVGNDSDEKEGKGDNDKSTHQFAGPEKESIRQGKG